MPRGIPNAKPAAGSARASDHSIWDAYAAAALIGMLHRNNQGSAEAVAAAANAADVMMAERTKRFGGVAAPDTSEDEAE